LISKAIKGWFFLIFSFMFLEVGRNHQSYRLLVVAAVFAFFSFLYLIADFVETYFK
jgi:hypothetical protein